MQTYARVDGGVVQELWPHDPAAPMPTPQPTPVQAFGEALGSQFVPCDAGVGQGWTYDGKAFAAPPPIIVPPLDLRAYAAAARYTKETGGISIGGAQVATDRVSQGLITGAWASVQIDPGATIQWKGADGTFVALDAKAITALASAVTAHVQASFAAEARVDADIAAGKVTTAAEVDAAFAAVTA